MAGRRGELKDEGGKEGKEDVKSEKEERRVGN